MAKAAKALAGLLHGFSGDSREWQTSAKRFTHIRAVY
jgi:hypothetical protein